MKQNYNHLDLFSEVLSSIWWFYLLSGIIFIIMGAIIFWYPQILIILITAVFVMIGLSLIALSLRVKKFKKKYNTFKEEFHVES